MLPHHYRIQKFVGHDNRKVKAKEWEQLAKGSFSNLKNPFLIDRSQKLIFLRKKRQATTYRQNGALVLLHDY